MKRKKNYTYLVLLHGIRNRISVEISMANTITKIASRKTGQKEIKLELQTTRNKMNRIDERK